MEINDFFNFITHAHSNLSYISYKILKSEISENRRIIHYCRELLLYTILKAYVLRLTNILQYMDVSVS
jgi:hypothetical protein